MKKQLWMILLICLCLCGCHREETPVALNFAVRIEVDGRHGGVSLRRQYRDPEKMHTVLEYLRSLRWCGKAEERPESIPGDRYRITVFLENGGKNVYVQKADRFLSRNAGTWDLLDPEQAALLYPLLESLGSDPL